MNFYVYSRQKAKKESYRLKTPTLIISVTDPSAGLNNFARNRSIFAICHVQFDDVTPESVGADDVLMTERDAEKIRDYVRAYKSKVENIIVHCEAGISRSAGIMAAIEEHLTSAPSPIFTSEDYSPNLHCYALTLEALTKKTAIEEDL